MSTQSQLVELIIQVTDQGTVVVKRAGAELRKYDKAVRNSAKATTKAGVSNKAASKTVDKFGKSVGKTDKKVKKSIGGLNKYAKSTTKASVASKKASNNFGSMHQSVGGLTAAVGTLALALGTIAFPAIKAAKFERSMSEVKAISGATTEEFKMMSAEARKLGAETEYSATQAASGLKYLTMAGLSATQATEALGNVLNIAQAGALDLGRAADIVTNIMTGFSLPVKELTHVNDALVQTFTSTNSTLEELGTAMAYVAPVAAGLGVDFDELVGTLGLLHNAGLKGSMAGTTLRGTLSKLVAPTKVTQGVMDKLGDRIGKAGFQVLNAEGNFVGFVKLIEQLEESGATTAEIMKLLGQRAGPGLAALLSQGSAAVAKMSKLNKESAGRAQLIADVMHDNTVGAFIALKSAVEETAIVIGNQLLPVLKKAAESFKEFVVWVGKAAKENPTLTKTMLGVVAAITAFVSGALLLGGVLASATWAVTGLTTTFAGLAKIFGGVSLAAVGLVGVLVSLVAVLAGLTFSKTFNRWVSGFEVFGSTIGEWGGSFVALIYSIFESAGNALNVVFQSYLLIPKLVFGKILETVGKFGGAIVSTITKIPGLSKLLGWDDNDVADVKKTFSDIEQAGKDFSEDTAKNYGKAVKAMVEMDTAGMSILEQIQKERAARLELKQVEEGYQAVKEHMTTLIKQEAEAIAAVDAKHKESLTELTATQKTAQDHLIRTQETLAHSIGRSKDVLDSLGKSTKKNVIDIWDGISNGTAVTAYQNMLQGLQRETDLYGTNNVAKMATIGNDMAQAQVQAINNGLIQIGTLYDRELSDFTRAERAKLVSTAGTVEERVRQEKELADAVGPFALEITEKKKAAYVKATALIKTELDKAYAAEAQTAGQIIALQDSIKNAKASTEEKVRSLQRKAMSEEEVFQDKSAEYQELMEKANAAVGVSYQDVEKYAKKAQAVASDLTKTSEDGTVSVSDAISKIQAAQGVMEEGALAAKVTLDSTMAGHKDSITSLSSTFDTISTKVAELQGTLQRGFIAEVALDHTKLDASIKEIQDNALIEVKAVMKFDEATAEVASLLAKIEEAKEIVRLQFELVGDVEINARLDSVVGLRDRLEKDIQIEIKKGKGFDPLIKALGEVTGMLPELEKPKEITVDATQLKEAKGVLEDLPTQDSPKIAYVAVQVDDEKLGKFTEIIEALPDEEHPATLQLSAEVGDNEELIQLTASVEELRTKNPTIVQVVMEGLQEAITSVGILLKEIAKLKDKTVTITQIVKTFSKGGTATVAQRPTGYNTGARIAGFGGGDKVHSLLEPGEWIIRKEAVQKYGDAFMSSVNNMRLPGFSMGGSISSAASAGSSIAPRSASNPLKDFGRVELSAGGVTIPALVNKDIFEELTTGLAAMKRFES